MTWEGVSQLVFGKGPFIKTSLEPRSHLGGTDSTPAPSKSPAVHPCQGCQFVAQSSDIVPCSNGCHFFKDKQLVSWEVAVPSLGKKRVENKQRCCFTRFLYISPWNGTRSILTVFFPESCCEWKPAYIYNYIYIYRNNILLLDLPQHDLDFLPDTKKGHSHMAAACKIEVPPLPKANCDEMFGRVSRTHL